MKTLILGGNGFIGSHLTNRLIAEGHSVRIFDRTEALSCLTFSGAEFVCADFGNRTLVAESLKDMDTVFHLISTTIPKTSNDDPAFDVMSNVVETIHLLEKCIECRVKKVVFVSSGGTVYGIPASFPVSEDSPTNPECSYGIAKLMIEKYVRLFSRLYGMEYVIVRPSNPYGPGQNHLGSQGSIAIFLGKIARGEKIELWGDSEITRDYIYVTDLVDGIYRAAVRNTASRVFNFGSGVGHSLNSIIEIMRQVVGGEIQVAHAAKRSFDVPKIYLDINRANIELDWRPLVALDVGIKITWESLKKVVIAKRLQ